jgi:hypothetical protein
MAEYEKVKEHKKKYWEREHFWTYEGVDSETGDEYGYCDRCKKYRIVGGDGRNYIKKSFYDQRMKLGKIEYH